MEFKEVKEFLKQGMRAARMCWFDETTGKLDKFVVYQKGYPEGIPCNKNTAEAFKIKEGSIFKCDPYFQTMDTHTKVANMVCEECLSKYKDWTLVND